MALLLAVGFGEGSGTSAADTSGNGYTLTVPSGAWSASGHTGAGLAQTSSGGAARANLGSGSATAWTRMAWVYRTAATSDFVILEIDQLVLYVATTGQVVVWSGRLSTYFATATSYVPLNTWTHLAITYYGSGYVWLVVNGVGVASGTNGHGAMSRAVPVYVGIDSDGLGYGQGIIDDVRVFDEALTDESVATWMSTSIDDGGGGGSAPAITTTLGAIRLGTSFSQTLSATGDTPITWTVQAGALPTGLSLNGSTGAITGTPTDGWTYDFTIRATNSSGNDDQQYTGTILFPDEVSRTTSTTTPGGTPFTRVVLSIAGDAAICYVPTGKAIATSSVGVVMAHGADDEETFAGNEPFETTEHCLDKGWVVISPYAHGNQVGNDIWQADHHAAADWVDALWPLSDFILYGASMGGFGSILGVARGTWDDLPLRGVVTIDMTWNMGWHWANGGTYELNLIRAAYDISPDSEYAANTAGYDPALYPASAYAGIRALLCWSPNDTLAIGTVDSLAFADLVDGVATVTLHETAGNHYAPENFATSTVNAWLDGLLVSQTINKIRIGDVPPGVIYAGSTPVTRIYNGPTRVWGTEPPS